MLAGPRRAGLEIISETTAPGDLGKSYSDPIFVGLYMRLDCKGWQRR